MKIDHSHFHDFTFQLGELNSLIGTDVFESNNTVEPVTVRSISHEVTQRLQANFSCRRTSKEEVLRVILQPIHGRNRAIYRRFLDYNIPDGTQIDPPLSVARSQHMRNVRSKQSASIQATEYGLVKLKAWQEDLRLDIAYYLPTHSGVLAMPADIAIVKSVSRGVQALLLRSYLYNCLLKHSSVNEAMVNTALVTGLPNEAWFLPTHIDSLIRQGICIPSE